MEENQELETKIETLNGMYIFNTSAAKIVPCILTIAEAASWLRQLISTNSLNLESIHDKLDSLFPVAIDYNKSLKTCKLNLPLPDIVQRLESTASCLWNAVAIAIKVEKDEAAGQMLCYSRLFVCVLLSIHETLIPSIERKLRVTQCYVSTLKVTIDHGWNQLHQMINVHLKENLSCLTEAANLFNEKEKKKYEKLKLEFEVSNFQDALKQGNIDLARQFEIQANIIGNVAILDSTLLLDLCRMIYNAILTLRETSLEDINYINYFLQRACEYLELEVPSLKTHADYSSLRYSILLLLANSQVDQNIETWDISKCAMSLRVLQNEYPKKVEPYSLGIDFCKKMGGSSVPQGIKEIIMRMISSVDILLNFDASMGIINEFANLDTRLALECLDYIFINKWDPERDHK